MNSSNIPSVEAGVNATSALPQNGKPWSFKTVFLLTSFLFMVLNSMPFSDASRFRKAIELCEKNLPRTQHCDVQGVVAVDVSAPAALKP